MMNGNERKMKMRYKVWNSINAPNEMHTYKVDSVDEAKRLINQLTTEQLHDSSVLDNAFGLEWYDETEQEWSEWYDEFGDCILEVMENENDN